MILLETPHTYDPGHGQPSIVYPKVAIAHVGLGISKDRIIFTMQYGDGAVILGTWQSKMKPFKLPPIQDKAAVMAIGEGPLDPEDPDSPIVMQQYEAEPASTDFTDMRDGLIVRPEHVGIPFYHALGGEWYQYLIDKGYYSGTIVFQ